MTGMEHPVALLRFREHLSVEDLAERSGVPAPTILAVEAGEMPLGIVTATALAEPLDIATKDLMSSAHTFAARRHVNGWAA